MSAGGSATVRGGLLSSNKGAPTMEGAFFTGLNFLT